MFIVMKLSTHPRWIAGLVAATFLVSSVGLPAAVQWCPESKSTSACACSMACCQPKAPTQKGHTAFSDPACCFVLFAGEKTETEFVQGNPSCLDCGKHLVGSSPVTLLPVASPQTNTAFTSSSHAVPFLSRDIPILVSSLLI